MDENRENMDKNALPGRWREPARNSETEAFLLELANQEIRHIGTWRIVGDSGWRLQTHSHAFYEFLYFVRGKTKVHLDRSGFTIHPCNLVIYPPGVTHHEYPNFHGDRHDVICAHFDIGANPQGTGPIVANDPHGHLIWLFERLHDEAGADGHDISRDLLRVILRHTAKVVAASGGRGGSIIGLATLYLQNYIDQSINVERIARAARTSPAYLGRTFARVLGTSPTHFAVLMKMETAKRKLSLTDDSVAEIGRTVGYEDPFYFSRLFRKVTGMSPREFRERARVETTPSSAR